MTAVCASSEARLVRLGSRLFVRRDCADGPRYCAAPAGADPLATHDYLPCPGPTCRGLLAVPAGAAGVLPCACGSCRVAVDCAGRGLHCGGGGK
jgi:hypothetical protein